MKIKACVVQEFNLEEKLLLGREAMWKLGLLADPTRPTIVGKEAILDPIQKSPVKQLHSNVPHLLDVVKTQPQTPFVDIKSEDKDRVVQDIDNKKGQPIYDSNEPPIMLERMAPVNPSLLVQEDEIENLPIISLCAPFE